MVPMRTQEEERNDNVLCCGCRVSGVVQGFNSPQDFVPREDSVSYSNGDSYEVWGRDIPGRRGRRRCIRIGLCISVCPMPSTCPWAVRCARAAVVRQCAGWHAVSTWDHPCLIVRDHPCLIVVQGEMLGPLRHGRGRHQCSNGDAYEGGWAYDKREGRGCLTLASGMSYDGEWKKDQAHG